jgi:hypothetical protein
VKRAVQIIKNDHERRVRKICEPRHDLTAIGKQLTAGQRIEGALQFGASADDDPLGSNRRSAGLVIGDPHGTARASKVQAVNCALNPYIRVGNADRNGCIPRKLTLLVFNTHAAERNFRPAFRIGLRDFLGQRGNGHLSAVVDGVRPQQTGRHRPFQWPCLPDRLRGGCDRRLDFGAARGGKAGRGFKRIYRTP